MRRVAAVFICLLALWCATPVYAESKPVTNKGLYVTPLREYLTANAGGAQNGSLTIANNTDTPRTVTLLAEQFAVADYTYDYRFQSPPQENWISISTPAVTLQPYKSQIINYSVNIPSKATPGGHYFTILAKTTIQNGSVTSNLQAATMLYVTVNGKLDHSNNLIKSSAPWIVFGGSIPYKLDIKNSGNAHFFAYVSGRLEGLTAKPAESADAHIILPGTTRSIASEIKPPSLPGVYKAVFGYRTDDGRVTERSQMIVFLPPWSVLIPVGLIIICWPLLRRPKKKSTDS